MTGVSARALLAVACLAPGLAAQDAPYTPFVAAASGEALTALERFDLAEGFEASLFAAEPLLANPVAFWADRHGVFWVAETFRHTAGVTDIRDHMDWLDADLAARTVQDRVDYMRRFEGEAFERYAVEHERVRRIVDTDGDGTADAATVFADGFDDPAAGIGAGLLEQDGAVYFTCIPDLWKLEDGDRDGVSDQRTSLSTGYGVHTALLGHDLHGLRIGPDGRLYFSCGDRGFSVETADGTLQHSDTGAVLRCELDGSNLEVFATGLRNPQELVFDRHGNLFTGDNNSDGGDKARLVYVVEGSDSGWRFYYQWIEAPVARGPWNQEQLWHPQHAGQATYLLPPIENIASGPSGFAYDPGSSLPADWGTPFFLCDFRGDAAYSGIWTFAVEPRGAGFSLGSLEKLVWNCLPTDVDFGPDGGLYFTDWVHGWNTLGKGRIFRVAHESAARSALARETRGLLDEGMGALGVEALAALLAHADQRVRQLAHLELARRGPAGVRALAERAQDGESRLARLHGIWGLWALGVAEPAQDFGHGLLARLLGADPDAEVRAQSARVLGDLRATDHAAALVRALTDPSARVRSLAAIAVGRLPRGAVGDTADEPLARMVLDAAETDAVLRHAALMGVRGVGRREGWALLAQSPEPLQRRAAVVVSRHGRDARSSASFLGDADPLVVLEAARAIHDEPLPEGLSRLAEVLDDPRAAGAPLLRRALCAARRVGGFEHAERLARFAADPERDAELRAEALAILAEWGAPGPRDRVLGRWDPVAPREAGYVSELCARLARGGLGTAPEPVLLAWIDLARRTDFRAASDDFEAWLHDGGQPSAVRIASLAALEALQAPRYEDALDRALGDADGRLRAAALSALERSSPADVLRRIPTLLTKGELAERRAAYGLLGRLGDGRASAILAGELERLAADLVPAELCLDLVLACEARGEPALRTALDQRGALREAADPELAPWIDALFGGDARAGRKLFEGDAELSCRRCHGIDEEPADRALRVGPDLGGVGARLTRLQLAESIVAPNRRPTPGFEGTVLFLHEGGPIAGRVVAETTESVSLMNAEGEVREVFLEDVAERRPDLSAMPQGLGPLMSRAELRDLVAFLASLAP